MNPVIASYMIEAAVAIAKETGFVPASEQATGDWIMENREAIVGRAIEIQRGILDRFYHNDQARKALITAMCANVWLRINARLANQEIDRAIA